MNLPFPPRKRLLPLAAGLLLTVTACSAGVSPEPSEQAYLPPAHPYPAPVITMPPAPTPTPETVMEGYDYAFPVPLSEAVEDTWFADTLFLGDSRTDGLRLYGGIKGAEYICYKGLSTFDYPVNACIRVGSRDLTAQQAVETGTWGKIYIMLGLNELGYPPEEYAAAFEAILTHVRATQPQAQLYVQSLIPINPQKAREKKVPDYVTNENVAAFNAQLTRICAEEQIYFINVSEALTDENGILPYDCGNDGVHFNREWYRRWADYLRTHTVQPQKQEEPVYEEPDPIPSSAPLASLPPAVPAALPV